VGSGGVRKQVREIDLVERNYQSGTASNEIMDSPPSVSVGVGGLAALTEECIFPEFAQRRFVGRRSEIAGSVEHVG
jgi:hypothetical protein